MRINGNDQDILCALRDVCVNNNPLTERIGKVSSFYQIN